MYVGIVHGSIPHIQTLSHKLQLQHGHTSSHTKIRSFLQIIVEKTFTLSAVSVRGRVIQYQNRKRKGKQQVKGNFVSYCELLQVLPQLSAINAKVQKIHKKECITFDNSMPNGHFDRAYRLEGPQLVCRVTNRRSGRCRTSHSVESHQRSVQVTSPAIKITSETSRNYYL